MGQRVDQIEDHIQSSREDLRSNLEELGAKVKSAVDWRQKFQANPGATLALAFGGGFVLGNLIGGSPRRRDERDVSQESGVLPGARDDRKGRVLRAWDDIQSALVGVVAAKVTHTLAEVVPGFKEQLAARDDEAHVADGGSGAH
jgi:hypothetical protein